MDFSSYTSEDFVADESFLNYCFNNNLRDVELWEGWIKNHPEKADDVANAKNLVGALVLKLPEEEYKQEYQKIKAAVGQPKVLERDINKDGLKPALGRSSGRFGFILKVAASFLVLVAVGYFAFQYLNKKFKEETVYVEKANPPGQKSTIFLKDGSKVILNSESMLRFGEDFGVSHRTLYLEGEAFFEVAKNTSLPFEVTAGNITTTALGTSFNIKAYAADSQINISLATGKVNITGFKTTDPQRNTISTILTPGEQIIYQVNNDQFEKRQFQAKVILGWKDGVIYFQDTEFDKVLKTLERWYGVKFEITNQNNRDSRFSGEFHNENLENVLEAMSYSQKFQYRIDKRNVTLDFTQ